MQIKLWELDEIYDLLAYLVFAYPSPVLRTDIKKYMEWYKGKKILEKLVTQRLRRLENEGLIKKEKLSPRSYILDAKKCPPNHAKILNEELTKLSTHQMFFTKTFHNLEIIYGLNPLFMNEKLRKKTKKLHTKIQKCANEVNKLKNRQIDYAITQLVSKLGTKETIKKLFKKHHDCIKQDLYDLTRQENITKPNYLLWNPQKRMEYMRKNKFSSAYFQDEQSRQAFLSEITGLSQEKKEECVTQMYILAREMKKHFPIQKHGITVLHPDILALSKGDTSKNYIATSFSELTDYETRFRGLFVEITTSDDPQKYVTDMIKEIHKKVKLIRDNESIPLLFVPPTKKEIMFLQRLNRLIQCKKCAGKKGTKKIILRSKKMTKETLSEPFVRLTYHYECKCGWQEKRIFKEIDTDKYRLFLNKYWHS